MKVIARVKWLAIAVVLAIALHLTLHISLGWSMVIFLVGWPVVGTIVTLDDDLPGGWSNPDGKTRAEWTYGAFWGELLLRGGLSLTGFAIDEGWTTIDAVTFWGSAVVGVLAGVVMVKTWPYPKHDG